MRFLVALALAGLLAACDQPEALIVHQPVAISVPDGLNTCPAEVPLLQVRTEADAAEVARSNRAAYIECRSTVSRILAFIKEAAEATGPAAPSP